MNRKNIEQVFKFGVAGTAAYLVDAVITAFFVPFLGFFGARIPAFLFSVTTAWIINRSWTFKEKKSRHDTVWKEYLHYFGLMIGGLVVNYTTYLIAAHLLPDGQFKVYIAVAFGCIAGMVVNFFFSRKFIYTKNRSE